MTNGSTVAIERSGGSERCPKIDLDSQKAGIFGKLAKLDAAVRPGDHMEIHHPIIADPKTKPRRARDGDHETD